MQDLKISLVQTELVWENPQANYERLENLLKQSLRPQETNLIILPEMFTTGFTMNPEIIQTFTGASPLGWMSQIANQFDAAIAGSAIDYDLCDNPEIQTIVPFNRMFFVTKDTVWTYDKRHLFRMAKEDKVYYPGKNAVIATYKGWRILLQICYDLRFPVFSRNRLDSPDQSYDLAIYVANWPQKRIHHWNRLLPARAIENQCYVAGVNRVGVDGNGHTYSGDSGVYDFHGELLTPPITGTSVVTYTLSSQELTLYRRAFPAWKDADKFQLL
ncbi:MAG: amidohydrolase [Bacteroidia bacterium]|nr:amidohydrolase [Bacteroidia bacterium]